MSENRVQLVGAPAAAALVVLTPGLWGLQISGRFPLLVVIGR